MARRFNSRRRRKKFYKKVATRTNLTRQVDLNRRKIRKLMYENEVKWFDYNVASTQQTSAQWNIFGLLTGLVGGSEEDEIIGQEINAKSSYLTYQITSSAGNTAGFTARVVLLWDKQPNAALAGSVEIFDAPTSPLNSKMNLENRKRFKVLYDKFHRLIPNITFDSDGLTTGTQAFTLGYKEYVKLTRKIIINDLQTLPTTNNLILAVGTPTMTSPYFFGFNHRLRYTDN